MFIVAGIFTDAIYCVVELKYIFTSWLFKYIQVSGFEFPVISHIIVVVAKIGGNATTLPNAMHCNSHRINIICYLFERKRDEDGEEREREKKH